MKMKFASIIAFALAVHGISAQTLLTVHTDSLTTALNINFTPGSFFAPKTYPAYDEFMNDGIHQNVIRTNAIESFMNNGTDLPSTLALLMTAQSDLLAISAKCDKLIFIFEKMPLWLSSSNDGSPAAIGGYYVFNTKPPASWSEWQEAVDSITSRLVNTLGITNAVFEIWNEPDMGSWTGTSSEYFELYRRTFDGIRSADPTAVVGGPTVNYWANNLYWEPPYGYVSNAVADSSLIGQLLDSSVIWNRIPDFISFHLFNTAWQSYSNATDYIVQKCNSLSIAVPDIIVSEWNAPSALRDTPWAPPFMVKTQLELSRTIIANHCIAAWQDFNSSTTEFHSDYGLLTYGAIHKPAYNSILLSEKLNGTTCELNGSSPFDGIASVTNDTVFVLVSNYCPLPFAEAVNHTLFQGGYTVPQLDSAGYIDTLTANLNPLDSIYKGLIVLPGADPLQLAVISSISVYQHFDSIFQSPRQFELTLNGHTGTYNTEVFVIDSVQNNMQFKYDSLYAAGYTQSAAIAAILPVQNLVSTSTTINGSQHLFQMSPNAVCLFKIALPGVSGMDDEVADVSEALLVFPNPINETLSIGSPNSFPPLCPLQIFDATGNLVLETVLPESGVLDVANLAPGLYVLSLGSAISAPVRFIKL